MTVWFTADTHFGHGNIITYCKRPYADVAEMDEGLIANWNERIGETDEVWHLGDFSWTDPRPYLSRLNGIKHLVRGNHEPMARVEAGWASVQHYKELKVDGVDLVLFHYGMRLWNQCRHGAVHLYGHSHARLPGDAQCCDVGVDYWDYRPVNLVEIKMLLATQPVRDEDAIEGAQREPSTN